MSRTQVVYEDMVGTTKRKKLKIYSEFNYSSRGEEVSELGPKPDCNQNFNNFETTFNTQWEDKTITDVYLRNPKSRLPNNIPPLRMYDTKLDTKIVMNGLLTDNRSYIYSGTDIKRLLIFMDYTYDAMLRLMKDDKTSKVLGTSDFGTSSVLVIDSEKLKNFFDVDRPENLMKNMRKQNFPGGDVSYEDKETSATLNTETNNSFDITIKQKCMEFQLSICKYSFSNLLETLTAVCNFSRLYFPIYDFSKVPSLYLGNWHFRNIAQGYLLGILLRNVNVNTLNVMRKLYFVLITDTISPILNIQINLILKHGVFLVYEADSSNTFMYGTDSAFMYGTDSAFKSGIDDSRIDQKRILKRSTSIDTWYIINKWNETKKNLITAITYSEIFKSDQSGKYSTEDLSQIDNNDDALIPYSQIESLDTARSDATINLTYHKSVGTSFIFDQSELRPVEKKSACTFCDLTYNTSLKTSVLTRTEWCLTKLTHGPKTIKTCLSFQNEFENINETMFDTTSTDVCVNFVGKYWKWITTQEFYKGFFQCLARSIIYLLFSLKI